jgi:predicted MFS family arabinose efflux permease
VAAFFYNIAFLTALADPPILLSRRGASDPIAIGLVFSGWGGLLAVAAVLVAPRLARTNPRTTIVIGAEIALALVLVACAVLADHVPALIVCVILAGIPLGLLNTMLTECSMEASELPRPVASSTYSGCRFLGGAIAPPLCTVLASRITAWVPFLYGALMILVSCLIILAWRGTLSRADLMPETDMGQAEDIGLAAESLD